MTHKVIIILDIEKSANELQFYYFQTKNQRLQIWKQLENLFLKYKYLTYFSRKIYFFLILFESFGVWHFRN